VLVSGIVSHDDWTFTPPPASELGDHDVPQEGSHLAGKRVALLVTGGIAAIKTPFIARALRRQGADVVAFVSEQAQRYVTRDVLEWCTVNPVIDRLTAAAEHLSDDRPFDAYLAAPATYNTINKLRHGIADGVVTSALASALGRLQEGRTRIVLVPTMHGSLHTPILTESLRTLASFGIDIVAPREDYGKHNIPSETVIVDAVCRAVSTSPLQGVPILVTGGPTPVPIDSVRRITNRFRGKLGVLITRELRLRGAAVELIHGDGAYLPPPDLPYLLARTYDEYRQMVSERIAAAGHRAAIFTAAVADYAPEKVLEGKTPSGGALSNIVLVPLPKVIEEVRQRFPELYMVTFKYQEGVAHERLIEIARDRLQKYPAVVANQGTESGPNDEQVAYLVTRDGEPTKLVGKPAIAVAIADHLERALS
jgi:phosphopantothenoylcysteine decarboxylase/phosphopantothenate--cysteine ligase